MNILMISAQKPDGTGSGVYLRALADSCVRAGHKVGIIAGIAAEDTYDLSNMDYVNEIRFETEDLPFAVVGMSDEMPYPSMRYRDMTIEQLRLFEAAFTGAIEEAIRDFHPDIIISHHLYLVTTFARELTRGSDIGVYAVCHSTDIRQMCAHSLAHDRIVAAIRKLDGIFALHEQQKQDIVACYGVDPDRIFVVGTGYDTHVFDRKVDEFLLAQQSGSDRYFPELIFVGKISYKKGVGSLIRAFGLFLNDHPHAHLTLIGGYGNKDEYDSLCELARPFGQSILFTGRLPKDEVVQAYCASDVFVLPSFYEGLPLVVIEALACGTRVVMSDISGIREWISTYVPDSPVVYVDLPRMRGVDEPYPEDLPVFEEDLCRVIEQALTLERCTSDLSALSWDELAHRIIDVINGNPKTD